MQIYPGRLLHKYLYISQAENYSLVYWPGCKDNTTLITKLESLGRVELLRRAEL